MNLSSHWFPKSDSGYSIAASALNLERNIFPQLRGVSLSRHLGKGF